MHRTTRHPAARFLRLAALALLIVAPASLAGDLTPPAGPVAPTFKTLHEVEPRTPLANDPTFTNPIVINDSGSYYLTEDIIMIPGQHGITINAEHVTLDLRGFSIRGNLEVPPLDGIHAGVGLTNLSVHNGSIVEAGEDGIDFSTADNCIVREVRVSRCGGWGIIVSRDSRLIDCVALSNGGSGFGASWGSVTTGCAARENGSHGFNLGVGNAASQCAAYANTGDGFTSGNGSTFSDCSSNENTGRGFFTPARTSYSNCSANNNTLSGFESLNYNSYLNCVSTDNSRYGFEVTGALIRGCQARTNSLGNGLLVSTTVFESVIP